ncbi:hypothetical protein niasHT_036326 [Heterodera trifolii]|uniref:Uncharacterized protein n=1 Tax=Heterodera trifolii TaxID=157864 RepID=A0ABD2IYN2_9BILA
MTGQRYYGHQPSGGYNNYGQFGGYHHQPPASYDYPPNQPYSNGYSNHHIPRPHDNFGRSQSDVHPYNHNQPPPGNYGRSQSDVHVHHQPTSYSNDSNEEAQRPEDSNDIASDKEVCMSTCKDFRLKKSCKKYNVKIGSIRCRCEWEGFLSFGKYCVAHIVG